MHALCAHAQGSVDLHVESYGVAGPLVETLYTGYSCTKSVLQYIHVHAICIYEYRECPRVGRPLNMILPVDLSMRAECMHEK